jgi:acid phosphatase (class A)
MYSCDMNRNLTATVAAILVLGASSFAQGPELPKPAKAAYFINPMVMDLSLIVPPPPAQDSAAVKDELAELHRIQQTRTPAQVAAAQADNKEEDIFIFRTVLGDNFRAEDLPLTAALSAHVHKDVVAADDPLKAAFKRPRPYQFDATLHSVCGTVAPPNSYPSGHSFVGYLEAFTLAQIVPEKHREILERADDYAHNRMVCGVHYLSDTVASRSIAYAVFGYMLATPRFQIELAAARAETRKHLRLN